jgi:signal transduction histidine kinase/CheY-like chemotaxis protein
MVNVMADRGWGLLFRRDLRDSEVNVAVAALREETLRLFLLIVTAVYVLWQSAITLLAPPGDAPRFWVAFPAVFVCLAGTYWLQQHNSRRATWYFLISSVLTVTVSIWLFTAPAVALFYPLVVLAAVVLLHPLAGVAIAVGSYALLLLLWQLGPLAFVSIGRLAELAISLLMTVIVAWALERNMATAVRWSLTSYDQALQKSREAQTHRAQLVQALRQLDIAYYRLQHANTALEVAWKAADSAERSKSEFVTNISHELRTPLNLIVGFSEMILVSPESYGVALPSVYRGDLNAVYRSAQHLLTLTNDVIDLARVGMDRLALVREQGAIGQVIEEACNIVREYIEAKGLTLQQKVQSDLPAMSFDRLRLRQVLLNLLTNAARFTERGSITVSAAHEDGWVRLQVSDTGRGIASQNLARVFDQYYHSPPDNPQSAGELGGFGLGLAISKRFVELHGGQMGVESTEGFGTTFWFTLPIPPVEGVSRSEPWRPFRPILSPSPGERIVVIASADISLTQFMQRHLRGYRVIAEATIADAVATATEYHAGAVLTDLATDEAAFDTQCAVPIIRLPLPHGERLASTLGVIAYLVKPITRTDLYTAISRLPRPPETVLIVDDDPRFVRLLTRILRASPRKSIVNIVAAHNGREAVDLMASTSPDVILLDLVMPEMMGREVLSEMAIRPELAAIPVIIMSAQDQIEGAIPLSGELALTKSGGFRLEELLKIVEAVLGVIDPPRQDIDGSSRTENERLPQGQTSLER